MVDLGESDDESEPNPMDPVFGPGAPSPVSLDTGRNPVIACGRGGIFNELGEVDVNFDVRLRCLQGWFIRSSWPDKHSFLMDVLTSLEGVLVLEKLLKSVESVLSKDVLMSYSQAPTEYLYDRVLLDDARDLDRSELVDSMAEDAAWILSLEAKQQTTVILGLMRIGGGGLVFNAYKRIDELYKERKDSATGSRKASEEKPNAPLQSESTDKYTARKLQQLERRELELTHFRRKNGLAIPGEKEGKKKNGIGGEVVDYLQVLPIWLNRKISLCIQDQELKNLVKVGKYWSKMIEETLKEKSSRTVIDAKIKKLSIGREVGWSREPKLTNRFSSNGEGSGRVIYRQALGQSEMMIKKNVTKHGVNYAAGKNKFMVSKKWELTSLNSGVFPERCCTWNNTHNVLAASTKRNEVELYSLRNGTRLRYKLTGFDSPITSLSFHEEGLHVVVGCADGSLSCREVTRNMRVSTCKGHTTAITRVSTTGDNVMTASEDGEMRIFHVWSGLCLFFVYLNVDAIVSTVALRTDNPTVAFAGTEDGRLSFVNIKKRQVTREMVLHDNAILQIDQDGDILVTGSVDGAVRMWDVKRLESGSVADLCRPYHDVNVSSSVTAIRCFENQVYVGCADGRVRLICEITGHLFKTFKAVPEERPVTGLAVFRERSILKLIIWHEDGIDMRAVSLEKYPARNCPKTGACENGKRRPIAKKRYGAESYRLGRAEATEERGCTLAALRHSNTPVQTFRSDVVTEMIAAHGTTKPEELVLGTFPRLERIQSF